MNKMFPSIMIYIAQALLTDEIYLQMADDSVVSLIMKGILLTVNKMLFSSLINKVVIKTSQVIKCLI